MPAPRQLKPLELVGIDFSGCPFFHEQGSATCRGYVVRLEITEERWDLFLRDVEYLDRDTGQWTLRYPEDEYCGMVGDYWRASFDPKTKIYSIPGYGSETHIGPMEHSFTSIDWPEMDYWPGGPLSP